MKKSISAAMLLLACFSLSSQISFTSKNFVPNAYQPFGYGVNMGAFRGWTDEDLANIAAGNPEKNVVGLEANSIRVWLPDWFTQAWGYDIRTDAFRHYEHVGMKDNVVFIGDASPEHRDSTMYCATRQSESFLNLYEPIWDGGLNGTPVNEENYYADYVYNLVLKYGAQVKYWEITNEPDTDLGGNATAAPGYPGNWWDNDPPPCETKFGAPIQHYVRMLRVAYEVVKSLQPDDFITTGGLGNKTFLDAVMRNTDNPIDGTITNRYPHKGGAYFDCLSFHAYPHYDGSMRRWSDIFGGFEWTRNSDKGVDGFFERMNGMVEVMKNYGYDGTTYPEKTLICTETNFSRNSLTDNFLGTEESQKNYVIKLLAEAQARNVDQVHFYSLADNLPPSEAKSDFDFMGLFENLQDVPISHEKILAAGTAFKTTASLLKGYEFSPEETHRLNLTNKVRGTAFKNDLGGKIFVLWATVLEDLTEVAEEVYTFPEAFTFNQLKQFKWDFSITGNIDCISKNEVLLTGSPIFLIPDDSPEFNCTSGFVIKAIPNPFETELVVEIQTDIDEVISIELFNTQGISVRNLLEQRPFYIGKERIKFNISGIAEGIYFLKVEGRSSTRIIKIVKG